MSLRHLNVSTFVALLPKRCTFLSCSFSISNDIMIPEKASKREYWNRRTAKECQTFVRIQMASCSLEGSSHTLGLDTDIRHQGVDKICWHAEFWTLKAANISVWSCFRSSERGPLNVNFTALMKVKVSDKNHLWAIIIIGRAPRLYIFYGDPRLLWCCLEAFAVWGMDCFVQI